MFIKYLCMDNQIFDNSYKVMTHDDVEQALACYEAELQSYGIEVLRIYTYDIVNVNEVFGGCCSVRLRFAIRFGKGRRYIVMAKYPSKNCKMWRDKKGVWYASTRVLLASIKVGFCS